MRPFRAALRPLPRLPAPLREGRELAPAALRAGLRPLPGLPAPLREGRELAPVALEGSASPSAQAPCSASRRAGACACGLLGSAPPSARAPCSAPRRTGACACGAVGRASPSAQSSLLRSAKDGSFTYADRPARLRLVHGICRSEAPYPAEGRPWLPFSDKPLVCLQPGTSVSPDGICPRE